MSIMSLEVHGTLQLRPRLTEPVNTRANLLANPEEDAIRCIFWCVQTPNYISSPSKTVSRFHPYCAGLSIRYHSGIIMVKDTMSTSRFQLPAEVAVDEKSSELEAINRLIDIVRNFDPDILAGYEVQSASWGYMIERARIHFRSLSLSKTDLPQNLTSVTNFPE